jgi:hypothetical protein
MSEFADKVAIESSSVVSDPQEQALEEEPPLSAEELSLMIEELCHMKAEEFSFLGYKNITGKEVWECVSSRYKKGMPPLHQIVSDILSLRVNAFMDWALLSMYKR